MIKPISESKSELHLQWHTKPVGRGYKVEYCVCGCHLKRLIAPSGFVVHVNGDRLHTIMSRL